MFIKATPEECGIKSSEVERFLHFLENNGVVMHSALFLRGSKIFGEFYWEPFHRDFQHRMYSVTKSFVGVAIGLLEEDGKLNLTDKIADYFPEKLDKEPAKYIKEQTIEDMLTMRTGARTPYWFESADPDRTHIYLNSPAPRPSGTIWEYDSPGSQVLATLVEKLSGMSLFDFLNERIFKHIGAFEKATILKDRNGDAWGDSALICTSQDLLTFARFVMNYGDWNGKRLMNEAYLRTASSPLYSNQDTAFSIFDEQGYGYQIWCNDMGGFGFHGMGCQYAVCIPEKDFIFVCTGDNQGNPYAKGIIFAGLKEFIVSSLGEELPNDDNAQNKLQNYGKYLKLVISKGKAYSNFSKAIDGVEFVCNKNRTGIEKFSFTFEGDSVVWRYKNAQGEKEIKCGFGYNEFGKFPQFGYSNDFGGARTSDGFLYNSASSAGWLDEQKLALRIQIIDRYFGNMFAVFAWKDNVCAVKMVKTAEDFLNEYYGEFLAFRKDDKND